MKYPGKIALHVFTSQKETAKRELEEKGEISVSYILFSGCYSTFGPGKGAHLMVRLRLLCAPVDM